MPTHYKTKRAGLVKMRNALEQLKQKKVNKPLIIKEK